MSAIMAAEAATPGPATPVTQRDMESVTTKGQLLDCSPGFARGEWQSSVMAVTTDPRPVVEHVPPDMVTPSPLAVVAVPVVLAEWATAGRAGATRVATAVRATFSMEDMAHRVVAAAAQLDSATRITGQRMALPARTTLGFRQLHL